MTEREKDKYTNNSILNTTKKIKDLATRTQPQNVVDISARQVDVILQTLIMCRTKIFNVLVNSKNYLFIFWQNTC